MTTQPGVGNKKLNQKVKLIPLISIVSTLLLVLGVITFYSVTNLSKMENRSITIFTKDSFIEIETDKTLVSEILHEAEIEIDTDTQRVFPSLSEELDSKYITIEEARTVMLSVDGEEYNIYTWAQTVEELLEEKEITIDDDLVNLSLEDTIVCGQEIVIVRVDRELIYEQVSIPSETTYRNDSSLTLGKEKVHTSPQEGIKKITYEIIYHDGEEISRKKVEEEVVEEPVTGVVLRGTQAMVSRSGSRSNNNTGNNATNTNSSTNNNTNTNTNTNVLVGGASFYGSELHGNRTASGVIFDMNAMTAAHRTLPFGTKVRVTNVENGKSVVVEINDRGPFVDDKIIDLSRAAAREIGIYPGVGRVRLEILD